MSSTQISAYHLNHTSQISFLFFINLFSLSSTPSSNCSFRRKSYFLEMVFFSSYSSSSCRILEPKDQLGQLSFCLKVFSRLILFYDGIISSVKTTPNRLRLIQGPYGIVSIQPAQVKVNLHEIGILFFLLLMRRKDGLQFNGRD